MANSKFKIFILSLLERLDLNQQSLDAFTNEESMIEVNKCSPIDLQHPKPSIEISKLPPRPISSLNY